MDPRQEVKSSPEDDIMEQNQSSVSLKKSSPSAQAFSVCLCLQKRQLAQPKRFGWLRPSEDVMMCKASFSHTHTSISCTEHTKPVSLWNSYFRWQTTWKKLCCPRNGKISRRGQSGVEHCKFQRVLQPICETACLFLSS